MNFNNLQKTNYKNKMTFLIIAFFVFTFIIYLFIINKKISQIKEHNINIIKQKNSIEEKIKKEKNKSIMLAKIKDISKEIEKIDSIFINKNKELEFITTLEGIAQKTNIQQEMNLSNQQKDEKTPYTKIPITLNIVGEFDKTMNYLEELEKSNYGINIKQISFYKNENQEDKKINIKITANTYWK